MSLSLHPQYHFRLGFTYRWGKGGGGGSEGERQREAYMHVNMHIHVRVCEYVHTHNNEVPHHTRCVRPHSPEVGNLPTSVCPPDITNKIKSLLD